jgi:hypothetical protein
MDVFNVVLSQSNRTTQCGRRQSLPDGVTGTLTNQENIMKVGDIVIYKEYSGYPSKHGITTHPAIVNCTGDKDTLDLTVFVLGGPVESVMDVPRGTHDTDGHCWWERE